MRKALFIGLTILFLMQVALAQEDAPLLYRVDKEFCSGDSWELREGYTIKFVTTNISNEGRETKGILLLSKNGVLLFDKELMLNYGENNIQSFSYNVIRNGSEKEIILIQALGLLYRATPCSQDGRHFRIDLFLAYQKSDGGYNVAKEAADVENAINETRFFISQEKMNGLNIAPAESLLYSAEQALNNADYLEASRLTDQAKTKTEEIINEATEIKIIVNETKSNISQVETKGINLTDTYILLSQAEQAFGAGDYTRAKQLADDAESQALKINTESLPSLSAISDATNITDQEKAKGYEVKDEEKILALAKQALYNRDYTNASQLANQSKAIAIDIDGDGVPNEQDFAPTINNNHIYSGAAIFLLGSIITIRASLKRKEKLRLECQRLAEEHRRQEEMRRQAERREQWGRERERRKAEEEKHRQEEEERRRLEGMKQDILEMIEEATKNE